MQLTNSFWETLPGLRPWTPLGDPVCGVQKFHKLNYACLCADAAAAWSSWTRAAPPNVTSCLWSHLETRDDSTLLLDRRRLSQSKLASASSSSLFWFDVTAWQRAGSKPAADCERRRILDWQRNWLNSGDCDVILPACIIVNRYIQV